MISQKDNLFWIKASRCDNCKNNNKNGCKNCPYMGGGLMQLVAYGVADIYYTSNSQDGAWLYGHESGEKVPGCSLKYALLPGKRGELQSKLSKELVKSFDYLYSRNYKDRPLNLHYPSDMNCTKFNNLEDFKKCREEVLINFSTNDYLGQQILFEDNTEQYQKEIAAKQ